MQQQQPFGDANNQGAALSVYRPPQQVYDQFQQQFQQPPVSQI
jgi:hypothetical protein